MKSMNDYPGPVFQILFGALTVAMLFLLNSDELFQVANLKLAERGSSTEKAKRLPTTGVWHNGRGGIREQGTRIKTDFEGGKGKKEKEKGGVEDEAARKTETEKE